MRDRGDLIYNSGSNYSRRNKPCTFGQYSYKRLSEYLLYTEGHLKILIDAQTSLQKQISTLEKQVADCHNSTDWRSIIRISSLQEQLEKVKAEIKALEAHRTRLKSSIFVSDEQRKAVFASMRDRGVLIEYGRSSYIGSSEEKFKILGDRTPRIMHKAVCSDCCAEIQVPFEPEPGRLVYCRECLPSHRKSIEKSEETFKTLGGFRVLKVMHKAVCSDCGAETQVPFKPDPHRPVYCRKCLPNHRKPREKCY